MTLTTVLTAVGDLAAGIAAVAAVRGLGKAREAVTAAQQTVDLTRSTLQAAEAARLDAEAARREAVADRREAERERRRQRLIHVGEIVEEVFWAAEADTHYEPHTRGWMAARNRLGHALVGLMDELPRCLLVRDAASALDARRNASNARVEIEEALRRVVVTRL